MEEVIIAICDDLEAERIGLARMVQSYARQHGQKVRLRLFSSGESLLAALGGREPIQLLFLDIYMPGLSGVETARRLHQCTRDTDPALVELGRRLLAAQERTIQEMKRFL